MTSWHLLLLLLLLLLLAADAIFAWFSFAFGWLYCTAELV